MGLLTTLVGTAVVAKVISDKGEIPGTKFVAKTIKGTVDSVKNVFNNDEAEDEYEEEEYEELQNVSKKCIACSAPLVGYHGQRVSCKYCDTEQVL